MSSKEKAERKKIVEKQKQLKSGTRKLGSLVTGGSVRNVIAQEQLVGELLL